MRSKVLPGPRIVLLLFLFAIGIGSSRCNARGDWYNPITGQRGCAEPPSAIDFWSSANGRPSVDHADLEAFLAKHPGAVNAKYGSYCGTPLYWAAERGRDDLAPLLIAHGADLRARDKFGNTPLQTAATFGRANVMTVLLASGADANASEPAERPPLLYAVDGSAMVPDLETRLAATKLLLAAGADINAREPGSERTALINAIGSGPGTNKEPMIELLLEHGADVRAHDSQGVAALVWAVGTGNLKVVRLLLDRGADAHASGKKDDAALGGGLNGAAGGGYADIAALLIDRGADVNWRYIGPQRIDWYGLPLAVALTVARSADKTTMARRREVALALMAHGADVNARNESGETLLHAAAADGDTAVLELLLPHGATIAARDRAGFTPLHRAVQKGHVDAATRLIASGADANAAAADGTTPLSLAAGDPEMEALIHRYAKD